MAQYRLGTVTATNNSTAIVGNGTFWVGSVAAGNLFEIAGQGVWYTIASVVDNTHLTLASNFVAATATGVAYAIQRDFTPVNSYPIPSYGDIDTSSLIRQSLLSIEATLIALSPVSSVLQGDILVSGSILLNGVALGAITSSTIDGSVIGGTTPAAGTFTSLTAATGAFSGNVSITGTLTASGASLTNLTPANISAGTASINITGSAPAASLTGSTLPAGIITSSLTSVGVLSAGTVPTSLLSGTLAAGQSPAYSGDATKAAGALVLTLANVNAGSGAVGSSTAIPVFTTNAKGLVTVQSTAAVIAPAGTLSGATLAASVTASSLTSVGTLASLIVAGAVSFSATTVSTSTTTGALIVAGGVGVAGALNVGSGLYLPSGVPGTTANALYNSSGALTWNGAALASTARTVIVDASYVAQSTDRVIAYTSLTTSRVVTLPLASSFPVGTILTVVNETISGSSTVTITAIGSGTDVVNGVAKIRAPHGYMSFESDGVGVWTATTISLGVNVPVALTVQAGLPGSFALANSTAPSLLSFPGAVGDGYAPTLTVSITSGSTVMTAAGGVFVAADIGKLIVVPAAGVSGAALITTIAGVTSNTVITLANIASTTVTSSSETITYGTDNYAALNSAVAAYYGMGRIFIPNGIYLISQGVDLQSVALEGASIGATQILSVSSTVTQPVLYVGGTGQVRDVLVGYPTGILTGSETQGQRVGITVYSPTTSYGLQRGGGIYNVAFNNVGTALYEPASTTIATFSTVYQDLRINSYSFRGVDFNSSVRTGNVYRNIYIGSVSGLTPFANADRGFSLTGGESETTIEQLNIEGQDTTTNPFKLNYAVYFSGITGFVISTIHIEGISLRGAFLPALYMTNSCGYIGTLSMYYVTTANTSFYGVEVQDAVDTRAVSNPNSLNFLHIGTLNLLGINDVGPAYTTLAAISAGVYWFVRPLGSIGTFSIQIDTYAWNSFATGDAAVYTAFQNDPQGLITWIPTPAGPPVGHAKAVGTVNSSGNLVYQTNFTIDSATGNALSVGSILSKASTSGIGYTVGAGSTVTQATSKATGVTLNNATGNITMNAASLAAGTIVSFTLTDSAIGATDVLALNHISGGTLGSYGLNAACAAGSATIYVRNNTAGALGEAISIQFVLIKGSNA